MPWLIPITEWQACVAERAIIILNRTNPAAWAGFAVSERDLTVPDSQKVRNTFVHEGIWKVEFDLDRAVKQGTMTSQMRATLRKSMMSLELKVQDPASARGRRVP